MAVADVYNYIVLCGPVTIDQIARGTAWGSIAVEIAVMLLLNYQFIVENKREGKEALYDIE